MLTAEVQVAGERLVMHPLRALHWPRMGWLMLSDLHLGMAAHLRKGGLPLPEGDDARTLQRLDAVIDALRPKRIVVIGDLFHSSANAAWERFARWSRQRSVPIHLVPGNHDILADRRYAEAGVEVCDESVEEGPFVLRHQPARISSGYCISGHLHPGIALQGTGRQRLRLPCFWFGREQALLPAFGTGTGLHIIAPGGTDRIWACTDRAAIDVSRTGSATQALT
ncbi:MAG: ligase-associated DNA damage response endonuclease PdeM [Flavobacteriales bacterium]|nr:MAG: ligase-associated DNA damage response endonuclease PdeM [Flavobacteriales bacterium]